MHFLPSGVRFHDGLSQEIRSNNRGYFSKCLAKALEVVQITRPLFPILDGSSVSYMAMLCEDIPLVLAITTLLKVTSVLSFKNPQALNCALVTPFTQSLCQLLVLMRDHTFTQRFLCTDLPKKAPCHLLL